MLFYLSLYLLFFIPVGLGINWRFLFRSSIFLVMALFSCLVLLRGDVGTDTHAYILIVQNIIAAPLNYSFFVQDGWDVEVGFRLLVKLTSLLVDSPQMVLNFVALFPVILYWRFLSSFRISISFLAFAALLISHFLLPYSMNVVRAGIATGFALFVVYYLFQKKYWAAFLCSLLAISFQFSVIFVIAGYLIFARLKSIKSWLLSAALIALLVIVYADRYLEKVELYSSFDKPNEFSGISIFVLQLALWVFVLLQKNRFGWNRHYASFLISAIIFLGTSFSYAFLRIADMMLLLSGLLVLLDSDLNYVRRIRLSGVLIVVIFTLSSFFVLRNISQEDASVGSHWVPYHFFWDKGYM